jgi:hypothetical protein
VRQEKPGFKKCQRFIYWKIPKHLPQGGNISGFHLGKKYDQGKREKGGKWKRKRKSREEKEKREGKRVK